MFICVLVICVHLVKNGESLGFEISNVFGKYM